MKVIQMKSQRNLDRSIHSLTLEYKTSVLERLATLHNNRWNGHNQCRHTNHNKTLSNLYIHKNRARCKGISPLLQCMNLYDSRYIEVTEPLKLLNTHILSSFSRLMNSRCAVNRMVSCRTQRMMHMYIWLTRGRRVNEAYSNSIYYLIHPFNLSILA